MTVSTLKPTVGMVVTDCPNFNLYRMAIEMEWTLALALDLYDDDDGYSTCLASCIQAKHQYSHFFIAEYFR